MTAGMRTPGHDGADPLVEYELRDPDGKGKRAPEKRQRRVDVLQQLYDDYLADETGHSGITEPQFVAGRRFQGDCETGELRSRSSPEMVARGQVCYFGLSDGTADAIQRSKDARGRLGKVFWNLDAQSRTFAALVLLERWSPSKAAEAIPGWNRHTGIPVLRIVLNAMARFYGC